jgi:transcription termination factor Rho
MELSVIQSKIYEVRGTKVMPDFDLAALYQVQTKVLKQAVKRNMERFPGDFMFELTRNEYRFLRSQIVTLEKEFDDIYIALSELAKKQKALHEVSDKPRRPVRFIKPDSP